MLLAISQLLLITSRRARLEPSESWHWVSRLAAILTPVLGMLAYSAYVYAVTGEPFVWSAVQAGWGRSYNNPLRLLSNLWWSHYFVSHPIDALNCLAGVFALTAIWPVTRRWGAAYGVFVGLNVLMPFTFGGVPSLGRYTSVLFPLFLWLGTYTSPQARSFWLALFSAGEALVAVLFFTWRSLY
jgi:hypothetical protein